MRKRVTKEKREKGDDDRMMRSPSSSCSCRETPLKIVASCVSSVFVERVVCVCMTMCCVSPAI